MKKDKNNIELVEYLAHYVSANIKDEAIKNRHKMKMLTLDIVWLICGSLFFIEMIKWKMFVETTGIGLSNMIITAIPALIFFIAYIKSVFDEKRCEICQER